MARCYSDAMPRLKQDIRTPGPHGALPRVWVLSDARNDTALEAALRHLPRGSGLVFRHYHLPEGERRARFAALARIARARGHLVVLSGTMRQARAWGADGAYGPAALLARGGPGLRLVTAHSLTEITRARRADALVLSPVFPTRSHPGGKVLGPLRFRLLAARARLPVIALGGMDARRASRLGTPAWAAIDAFLR
jgi:thiamine-phosphate pyrophosphorylase